MVLIRSIKFQRFKKIYTTGVLGVYPPGGNALGPAWGPTIAEAKLIDPTHPMNYMITISRHTKPESKAEILLI
jgi:hypothetical protein